MMIDGHADQDQELRQTASKRSAMQSCSAGGRRRIREWREESSEWGVG